LLSLIAITHSRPILLDSLESSKLIEFITNPLSRVRL